MEVPSAICLFSSLSVAWMSSFANCSSIFSINFFFFSTALLQTKGGGGDQAQENARALEQNEAFLHCWPLCSFPVNFWVMSTLFSLSQLALGGKGEEALLAWQGMAWRGDRKDSAFCTPPATSLPPEAGSQRALLVHD